MRHIVERSPLDYGHIVSSIKGMSNVFQDINKTLLPDSIRIASVPKTLFQAEMIDMSDDRPLRVLCVGT
jgi:hypothetical protein